jgi:oligoendopeptidase F
MSRARMCSGLITAGVIVMSVLIAAQERDRSKVAEKYTWNLADIYPDLGGWRAAKDKIKAELPAIRTFAGKLGQSPQTLAEALETKTRLEKELSRLYVYASMLADQDTRLSDPQGMQQEMQQLFADFGAQAAYIEPEILKVGSATIDRSLASEPRLKIYSFYLHDVLRRATHTLTDAEEKILADAQPLASSASNIYGILSNADFPYPTIKLSDGTMFKVDQSGFGEVRTLKTRQDREVGMSAFFNALGSFSRTFGTTMNSSVQKSLFYAKARKYPSTLDAALDVPNIPTTVYTRLIDGVNKNLPTFHRYLRLRKRMLGLDQLHYYDLYAPLVSEVNLRYTPDEAERHVLAAVAPLGPDYATVVTRAFNSRWIDYMPKANDRVRIRMAAPTTSIRTCC